jgi:hypothetical protein
MREAGKLESGEVAKLLPFLLVGSLLCAVFGAVTARFIFSLTDEMALAVGLLCAGVFVGLTFDWYRRQCNSGPEFRWALGTTLTFWVMVPFLLAGENGLVAFGQAVVVGFVAHAIKRWIGAKLGRKRK